MPDLCTYTLLPRTFPATGQPLLDNTQGLGALAKTLWACKAVAFFRSFGCQGNLLVDEAELCQHLAAMKGFYLPLGYVGPWVERVVFRNFFRRTSKKLLGKGGASR